MSYQERNLQDLPYGEYQVVTSVNTYRVGVFRRKVVAYVFVTPLSGNAAGSYLVFLPENFSCGNTLTVSETAEGLNKVVCITSCLKEKSGIYKHPEDGVMRMFRNALTYVFKKKVWVLTHVDGKPVEDVH